jgi:hypothetical protein
VIAHNTSLGLRISSPNGSNRPPEEGNMGRFFALTLAALMGLGLLSMSLAQAQDAHGGIHGNSVTTELAR